MAELGKEPEFIVTQNERPENTISALAEYIERHGCPDGIFCYNDEMAMSAYAVLGKSGRRIPEDVALIGCDGIRETRFLNPSLTTIAQPLEKMCTAAWSLLMQRVQDPTIPLQHVVLPAQLEIRDSTRR